MLKRYFPILFEPYPDDDSPKALWSTAIWTGILVFVILYSAQPFGISTAPNVLLICAIFGGISALVTISYEAVITYVLKLDRQSRSWVFWKWLVLVAVLIVCIAAANYIYIVESLNQSYSWRAFTSVTISTFVIGIIPTFIFGGIGLIRSLRKHQALAAEMEMRSGRKLTPSKLLTITSTSKSEPDLEIESDQLLYIQAMQNYIQVVYTHEGELHKTMLRNTLSAVQDQLSNPDILRCHRSFLVHQGQVIHVSGNAQGLELMVHEQPEIVVPVSRKYVSVFRG